MNFTAIASQQLEFAHSSIKNYTLNTYETELQKNFFFFKVFKD